MIWIIGMAMKIGIPARFAKVAVIGGLVIVAILALIAGKALYDRSVITDHDADQAAKIAPIVRAADEKAAAAREADNAQIAQDEKDVTDALEPIPDAGLTDRQRTRSCAILRRQAKSAGRNPPAGC